LADPDQENPSFSEDVVYDSVCRAHAAILPWVPNYKEVLYTATSGSGLNTFELPSDVYDIQSVQLVDEYGTFISRATLAAGTSRGNSESENDWTVSPTGYLSLAYDITAGNRVRVYYLALWEIPASAQDTTFILKVPDHAIAGLMYYAMSLVLIPTITDTSTLGTFKSKVDSGTPIHNPARDNANWYRSLFLQEMKMMPPYQKAKS